MTDVLDLHIVARIQSRRIAALLRLNCSRRGSVPSKTVPRRNYLAVLAKLLSNGRYQAIQTTLVSYVRGGNPTATAVITLPIRMQLSVVSSQRVDVSSCIARTCTDVPVWTSQTSIQAKFAQLRYNF